MDELKQNQVIAEELTKRLEEEIAVNEDEGGPYLMFFVRRKFYEKPFTQSLDSCRIFELALSRFELEAYTDKLMDEWERTFDDEGSRQLTNEAFAVLATPAQRCEAFLRTIGKFEP